MAGDIENDEAIPQMEDIDLLGNSDAVNTQISSHADEKHIKKTTSDYSMHESEDVGSPVREDKTINMPNNETEHKTENKLPSTPHLIENNDNCTEHNECSSAEKSDSEIQLNINSEVGTPLNLSDSSERFTPLDTTLSSKLSCELDDASFPTVSRCKVYERDKIHSRLRRGFSENSLAICGINNLLVPYKCREDCDFASVSLSSLKIHSMLKHAGEEFYLCTLCGERFVCDDSLLEHVCKHHYDQHKIIYKCRIEGCSKYFRRVENLKDHLLTEHKGYRSVPCSFCFREYYSAEAATNHIRNHLKRTLRCAYCFLIFNTREEVIKHLHSFHDGFLRKINVHIEVINHKRLTKNQNSLKDCLVKVHASLNAVNYVPPCEDGLIIYPSTKPLAFQCQDCSYTCTDNNLLNSHVNEGHLENADITKDFSCNFCKFSTNIKEAIFSHLSFHTNAKYLRCYSCPYCPKQSNSIDIIESHLHSQHPYESFKFEAGQESISYLQDMVFCPVCNRLFKWKSNFCNHLSTEHNLKTLADYLMYQCNVDASKASLIIPKQFLTDKIDSILPDASFGMPNASNQTDKLTSDEFTFKCVKCDFRNSNYNIYNEHVKIHREVYNAEENLKSTVTVKKENSMLFVCQLCPFQCNKSLNFKRHSAIHERAKSLENCFRCGYCMFKHNRINCIKFHLGKYHERLPIKVIKIMNGEEVDVTKLEIIKNSRNSNTLGKDSSSSSAKKDNKTSNEYFDSFLPRGMIFAEPVKCPNCDYANRVRINLIRHMRQHLYEDLVQMPTEKLNTSLEPSGNDSNISLESPPLDIRDASEETFGDTFTQSFSGDGVTTKKLFKCAYCDVVSKWNRRDISLHILHVHLQKKVYTCSYCDYGSRKSSQMVMNHCARVHPGKPVIIKDELALFNSVVPLRDGDGVVTVAYVRKNGLPILSLPELGMYLKVSVRKNKNDLTLASSSDKEDKSLPGTLDSKMSSNETLNQDIDEEDYSNNVDNSEEWKCMFCGLQMFSEVMMKRHVMCHHLKLKPYSCKYCKAQYWQKQSVENHVRSNHPDEEVCFIENVKDKISLLNKYMQKITNIHRIRQTPSKKYSSIYHCRICGYQDPRHDKAKYHVVKKHLKIGLYSCSKCHQYMGGKGCVENHIQELHSSTEAHVCRSYDIHALFLQKNIKKVSNFSSQLNKNSIPRSSLNAGRRNPFRIKQEHETLDKTSHSKTLLTCSYCSYVAESEASLGAHSRVHKMFSCFYCDYQNNLVSRVQSHCLIRHPSKPIKHRQIAPLVTRESVELAEESLNKDINSACESDNTISEMIDFPESFSPCDATRERSTVNRPGLEYLYKCKLCSYTSDKATVIRHHIMSHLLYHPYQCPYCNLVCSVKSSPITKHIQLKHPDKEIRFICKRDEQMEKQVRNSFEKVSLDPYGNITNVEMSQVSPIIKDEEHFAANQRIYYKCCFCSLVTPIRTDMKHHLMRELKYKPFSCAYCQYEEPCRSKMGKHFRIKHPDMTISIKHSVNAKKELQIFEHLQKCMVKNSLKKSGKSSSCQEKSGNIPIIRISNLKNVLISSLHYRGKFHKCSQCQFKTSNIKVLISHKSIHDEFKLKCCYCQYANGNIFLLRRHMKRCHLRYHLTPATPRRAKSDWLKSHKQKLSEFVRKVRPVLKAKYLERWKCCYCPQKFLSLFLLREHLNKNHSCLTKSSRRLSIKRTSNLQKPSPITFCCNECHLKFSAMHDFSRHLQTHFANKVTFPLLEVFPDDDDDDSRSHQCGFCSFQTTQEEEFTTHITTHTALHPIKCKYCLFASFTSSDMKQHFEVYHSNQDVRFDSLTLPYTMVAQNDNHIVPNFKPIVKLVDLKFCLS